MGRGENMPKQTSQTVDHRSKRAHACAQPATPAWITPQLVDLTIKTLQPFYRDSITAQEASTILQSLGRLFGVLSRG